MKITAIKQQVKQVDRYSIYVDDAYAFSLSASALLETGIVAHQALSATDIRRLKKLSADDKAYATALAYITRRRRSRWEMEVYFERKGYDADLSAQLLSRLENLSLVDDADFADAWVRNRRLLKPVSARRLVQELRQKRVPEEVIAEALALDESDDEQTIRQMITQKKRQPRYSDPQKLLRYLARQGYSYKTIRRALSDDEER